MPRLRLVIFTLLVGTAFSAVPLRKWNDSTHSRNAVPDYARVDIQVAPADWARLAADMEDMAGPAGAASGDDVELLPRTPIYIPATINFEGITFEHVGLRLKSNSSLLNSWRSGIDIAPFVVGPEGEQPGHTFLGNAAQFDDSVFGANGLVSYIQSRFAAIRCALPEAQ